MGNQTTFSYGKVQAATTPVRINANPCDSIALKAAPGNTGIIYIGDSSVADTTGFPLSAGEGMSFDLNNTGKIYVYGVAGNYVNFFATN